MFPSFQNSEVRMYTIDGTNPLCMKDLLKVKAQGQLLRYKHPVEHYLLVDIWWQFVWVIVIKGDHCKRRSHVGPRHHFWVTANDILLLLFTCRSTDYNKALKTKPQKSVTTICMHTLFVYLKDLSQWRWWLRQSFIWLPLNSVLKPFIIIIITILLLFH